MKINFKILLFTSSTTYSSSSIPACHQKIETFDPFIFCDFSLFSSLSVLVVRFFSCAASSLCNNNNNDCDGTHAERGMQRGCVLCLVWFYNKIVWFFCLVLLLYLFVLFFIFLLQFSIVFWCWWVCASMLSDKAGN